MDKLSVVVPVYCCAQTISALGNELKAVGETLEKIGVELEPIFVDDGSNDDSLNELIKLKSILPLTKIVKLTRNFGAVGAVKAGFKQVSGNCFVTIAADLQDPVDMIPEMVARWKKGARYVILVRQSRQDPATSKFMSGVFYFLVRLFIFKNYPHGGFDVALMDKAMLPYMQDNSKNQNPSLYSYNLGFTPTIIPYHRRERKSGKSTWSLARKVNYFVDSLMGFSIVPLRFVTGIGLLVALGSFVYAIMVIVGTIFGEATVPGFPSLAVLISFLSGSILFALGMIGEYIWRIFDEVTKRPEFVVEDIF
jgi:polyisoprenyl-phosphate glycosyltransferase